MLLRLRGLRRGFAAVAAADKKKYSKTLNLPKTAFPMKANARVRDPILRQSCAVEAYEWQKEHRQDAQRWTLHDGPPYANGSLHLGHCLNKVVKDVINRYKLMQGHAIDYYPGWDCHGLPIELKALEKVRKSKSANMSAMDIRRAAKKWAQKQVQQQKAQFESWGVMADWDASYVTMDPCYEGGQIEVFKEMVEKGLIYRALKPVYWSPSSRTALAEAELEYEDAHVSRSMWVAFPFTHFQPGEELGVGHDRVDAAIWTTTAWTLPSNRAIAYADDIEYVLLKRRSCDRYVVVASELADAVADKVDADSTPVARFPGSALHGSRYQHPFMGREGRLLAGDHVTTDNGTGLVHTAPAHGMEDFLLCKPHDIEVGVPVDGRGVFTDEVGSDFAGLHIFKHGTNKVSEVVQDCGALLLEEDYAHRYPYDWRTKQPVILRATEQWFVDLSDIQSEALDSLDEVHFVPASGKGTLRSMIQNRAEWCISRQRHWGVPIPVFYDEDDVPLLTSQSISHVQKLVREHGADCWWEMDVEQLLAPEYRNNGKLYTRGTDTMDVWFDSGSSWRSALGPRGASTPSNLVVEGHDQYRGWFQSSLLTSVATTGRPPYEQVLTHGFLLDDKGAKMSKSLGNMVSPDDVLQGRNLMKGSPQYGADVLRLWAASKDYMDDVRFAKVNVAFVSDGIRRFRNSMKYMLGVLSDFDPAVHGVEYESLDEVDRFMLHQVFTLQREVTEAYESYSFQKVFQLCNIFTVSQFSGFYVELCKDRLYADGVDTRVRRSAQTVLSEVLDTLHRLLAPITCHLSEDVFQHNPHRDPSLPSASCQAWPSAPDHWKDERLAADWQPVLDVRDVVNRLMDSARKETIIGSSLEADVTISVPPSSPLSATLQRLSDADALSMVFVCSRVSLDTPPHGSHDRLFAESVTVDVAGERCEVEVGVRRAEGGLCLRCWKYHGNEDSDVCRRCERVLRDS